MTRLLPGPAGADSPHLEHLPGPPPADLWHAWLAVADDRAAGRPSHLGTLAHALDLDTEPTWNLWWDRPQPGGILTHRAALVTTPAAATLVTACGHSTPARPNLAAWEIGDRAIRDSRRTYCAPCTRLAPAVLDAAA